MGSWFRSRDTGVWKRLGNRVTRLWLRKKAQVDGKEEAHSILMEDV